MSLSLVVPRGSVTANDGAVTYYAQYGRTLHARAAACAEPRNHGARDCRLRFSSCCQAYENYTRGIYDTTKPSAAFGGTFSPS